jgi:hypothetical protein
MRRRAMGVTTRTRPKRTARKTRSLVTCSLREDVTCVISTAWKKWNRIFIHQKDKDTIEVVLSEAVEGPAERKAFLIRRKGNDVEVTKPLLLETGDDTFYDPVSPQVTTPFPVTGNCSPAGSQCVARLGSTTLGTYNGHPAQSYADNFSFMFPAPGDTIPNGNYKLQVLGTPPLQMNVTVTNP